MPEVVEPEASPNEPQATTTSETGQPTDQLAEELLEQYLLDLANYTELATRTETITQNPNFAGVAGSIYKDSSEDQLQLSGQASNMRSPTVMPTSGGGTGGGY